MNVLVINSGSSSIKYSLFRMPERRELASGLVERIGEPEGKIRHRWCSGESDDWEECRESAENVDHAAGMERVSTLLRETLGGIEIDALGHRVVHGGEAFSAPTAIDDEVVAAIERLTPLAPLHNPANLTGIRVGFERFPGRPQVAVFDTAFHQTMPRHAFLYALPAAWYRDHGVRRYGFHGSSHSYVARRAAEFLGRPLGGINLITLHLGNGASAAAIQGGRSIDTSMGLTPMEGLVMGTRCGDIDPAIPFHLKRVTGADFSEIEAQLNRESGLKGLAGDNDMRAVQSLADEGDEQARVALAVYAYRIRKTIGAYTAALGRVDAVVFTGGIGENSVPVRQSVCRELHGLDIVSDEAANASGEGEAFAFHAADSRVALLVIETREELEIALATEACLGAH